MAGTITNIQTVIDGVITSGDAVITTEINGTEVTDSAITIANVGSAAGIVDSAVPTALNVVAVGDTIEAVTDAGSTDAASAVVNCEITLS